MAGSPSEESTWQCHTIMSSRLGEMRCQGSIWNESDASALQICASRIEREAFLERITLRTAEGNRKCNFRGKSGSVLAQGDSAEEEEDDSRF